MRSAFGAGSLDGIEESVELGAGLPEVLGDVLGGVLESVEDGVLDVDGDVLCGIVLGSVVVAPGAAVGFWVCSVAGAPCAGGAELLSVVCA